ncbi:MAG: hypothetical protein U0165_01530 [Polyangiaceae bacterium]
MLDVSNTLTQRVYSFMGSTRSFRAATATVVSSVAIATFVACASPPASEPATPHAIASSSESAIASASSKPEPLEVRLLYTSDEHGWVAPVTEKGKTRGGAAAARSMETSREALRS